MSTLIRVSLLIFLMARCCSSFGDYSLKRSSTTIPNDVPSIPPAQAQPPTTLNDSKINIVAISIVNDLSPPYYERLFFLGTDQPVQVNLDPGVPYDEVVSPIPRSCYLIWRPKCANFYRYDPNVDDGHHDIYWSIRDDGAYHSWDNQNWNKVTTWREDHCL